MKLSKLSVQSHWLLQNLAKEGLMCSTNPMNVHWSQQPSMSNMRGLVKRGWAIEEHTGLFRITEEGRKAAQLIGPCPPVEERFRHL